MKVSFFQEFKKQSENTKNIIFSPFGFDMAFRILIERTEGETQKELLKLYSGDEGNKVDNLLDVIHKLKEGNAATNMFNSIEFEYNKILKPNEIFKLNEEHTDFSSIEYIESDDPEFGYEIRNIMFFEEEWLGEFDEMNIPNYFYLSSIEKIAIKFIRQFIGKGRKHTRYYSDSEFSAIQIPLKSNKNVFEIYLPNSNSDLRNLINNLSFEKLEKVRSEFYFPEYIEVVIPEFDLKSGIDINIENKGFGLSQMYMPSHDFKRLFHSEFTLFVKKISQTNKIKVSKDGIKGESETIIYGGIGGLSTIGEHILFEADRPFVYMLRDNESGTCLLMGVFEEPSPETSEIVDQKIIKEIEQAKIIRKFKPTIHQLTIKARVYIGLVCLNLYVKERNLEIGWAMEILKDIIRFVEISDSNAGGEIRRLDFGAYEVSGYYCENKYFTLEESIELREKNVEVTEIISSINSIVKYGADFGNEDGFYSWSYSSMVRILELLNKEGVSIPNLDPYKYHVIDKTAMGDSIVIDREIIKYLPFSS